MITIVPYQSSYQRAVVALVLGIQQGEFNLPVTLQDQPDLQGIETFFRRGHGNFWVALADDGQVVGSIGLLDIGEGKGVIRKMFVASAYRGTLYGTASALLQTLEAWAQQRGISELYLGTISFLEAAVRFYTKQAYVRIAEYRLPPSFPRMAVDDQFFYKALA